MLPRQWQHNWAHTVKKPTLLCQIIHWIGGYKSSCISSFLCYVNYLKQHATQLNKTSVFHIWVMLRLIKASPQYGSADRLVTGRPLRNPLRRHKGIWGKGRLPLLRVLKLRKSHQKSSLLNIIKQNCHTSSLRRSDFFWEPKICWIADFFSNWRNLGVLLIV